MNYLTFLHKPLFLKHHWSRLNWLNWTEIEPIDWSRLKWTEINLMDRSRPIWIKMDRSKPKWTKLVELNQSRLNWPNWPKRTELDQNKLKWTDSTKWTKVDRIDMSMWLRREFVNMADYRLKDERYTTDFRTWGDYNDEERGYIYGGCFL